MIYLNNIDYIEVIRPKMGEKRFAHSVNVAKAAVVLAEKYGADVDKAYTAGILHDITKEFSPEKQLQIINDGGIILDNIQKHAQKLWHSISGSIYIQTELGINDSDIINAIKYHTTGRAGMSLLEKVIFIADFISAERTYTGVQIMREKAQVSLEEAMIYSYQFTFTDLSSRELAIHTDEVNCYNELILNKQKG